MPEKTPAKPGNLSIWLVLIGAAGGIFTGLFLGDYARVLQPVGDLYAMLLEVAVYPYLICSLLHGLGKLTPAAAWKLFRSGWVYYVALWVITFGTLAILAQGIPPFLPKVFQPETATKGPDLLQMLIPSDPFTALSDNYVPAVILFCVAFGIALQQVKEKEPLLSMLESVRLASLAFWNSIVRFAPVAVFALFGAEAGTLRVHQAESIAVFLFLFFAGALVLAFWVLPALVAAVTPLKYLEILPEIRSAFVIAVITTLSVAALPFITAATQRLADSCGIDDPERDDVIRTNISVAYPLGQLGNFFVVLFIVFATSFYGVRINSSTSWFLYPVSFLSCIGSPTSSVNAVQFLTNWLGLPDGTPAFYVGLMAFIRYGQVIASVSGFAFLSFTVVLAYYGKIRVRPFAVASTLVLGLAAFIAFAFVGEVSSRHVQTIRSNPYLDFSLDPRLAQSVKVSFSKPTEATDIASETSMEHIQRTGELRVGYNDSIIPFCYRNANGQLVGYDVAYAYQLAADLNVTLTFVPFEWSSLQADLDAHKFDIAMAGIYVTADRLAQCLASTPYYQSSLAFFLPRERVPQFRDRSTVLARNDLRLGVFNDPVLIPRVHRSFPNAKIVIVPDYRTIPDFTKIDAAVWTLTQAEALAITAPNVVAVEPSNSGDPYLYAYLMPHGDDQFANFVNYWRQLKRSDGFEQAQRNYWINRQPRGDAVPRWSILRNVLGINL